MINSIKDEIEAIYRAQMNDIEERLATYGCETIAFLLDGSRMFTRQLFFTLNPHEDLKEFSIAKVHRLAEIEFNYLNSLADFLEVYRKEGVTDVRNDSSCIDT